MFGAKEISEASGVPIATVYRAIKVGRVVVDDCWSVSSYVFGNRVLSGLGLSVEPCVDLSDIIAPDVPQNVNDLVDDVIERDFKGGGDGQAASLGGAAGDKDRESAREAVGGLEAEQGDSDGGSTPRESVEAGGSGGGTDGRGDGARGEQEPARELLDGAGGAGKGDDLEEVEEPVFDGFESDLIKKFMGRPFLMSREAAERKVTMARQGLGIPHLSEKDMDEMGW